MAITRVAGYAIDVEDEANSTSESHCHCDSTEQLSDVVARDLPTSRCADEAARAVPR